MSENGVSIRFVQLTRLYQRPGNRCLRTFFKQRVWLEILRCCGRRSPWLRRRSGSLSAFYTSLQKITKTNTSNIFFWNFTELAETVSCQSHLCFQVWRHKNSSNDVYLFWIPRYTFSLLLLYRQTGLAHKLIGGRCTVSSCIRKLAPRFECKNRKNAWWAKRYLKEDVEVQI